MDMHCVNKMWRDLIVEENRERREQYATALHHDWDVVFADIRKRQASRIQKVVRPIGNSQGIVIPKPLLAQLGLDNHADMTVERGALVLRRPTKVTRTGWAAAAKKVAGVGDDKLVVGEFGNQGDTELDW